ncbi:hypothetical protein [Limosilactobacillus fermentum]|uniref:Uncharacterized protein n=1 Tax=Limosilactobacillus fermentum NB-22 TaxID=1408443 RepID=A0A829LJY4_LIMFE|nr:hypothetical protein [Limosilactobacillus fermentum]ESS00599.1 hypothetical protein NB22_09345 [Limosilactobacillus fermentum NB-22]MCH5396323.1 hypothetical protein [Limosilactobacillus fermentum]MDA3724096.1 hypothetical protein [Limosilactobacillus fermentum]MDA3761013.1 hypothetical protein [Limosilactobacillus fermentum]NHD43689.1 hypothetical protein [Limosilactobacillus fermentum]
MTSGNSDNKNKKEKLVKALDASISSAFTKKYKEIITKFDESEYNSVDKQNKALENDLNELVEYAKELDPKFLPYASITAIVYRAKNTTDLPNYSQQIKLCMKDVIKDYEGDNLNGVECVIKLIEHFDLATNQMSDLYSRQDKEIKEVESNLSSQNDTLKKNKGDLEEIVKQLNGVETIKGTIYTEFITILGIFSAFIFGIFGGFQSINTTLNIFEKNRLIGKPLMMSATIMIALMIILYMFIGWLGQIVGRPLRRTCYKCKENGNQECVHIFRHLIIRHIGFSVGIFAMMIVFTIGLVLALTHH